MCTTAKPTARPCGHRTQRNQKNGKRVPRCTPSFCARKAQDMQQTGGVSAGDKDMPLQEPLAAVDEADECLEVELETEDHVEDYGEVTPPPPSTYSPMRSPCSISMDVHGLVEAMDIDCGDDSDGVPPVRWDSFPMEGVVYAVEAEVDTEPMDIDEEL